MFVSTGLISFESKDLLNGKIRLHVSKHHILQNESLYPGRFLEKGSNLFICSSALQYKNG